ncbi:RagB/SusD family nutrient uptake outer membrane protein [Marinilabilia salmonicolor]|uniref:RagB/SusD family nutrient uptake outer membrane protein n=1 Tax=Marinilabilia salmonicolor TaxID=989 RepID=UPI00029A1B56|nr:RagB/SusD family nutrient uptake outer membrane protein [Marinilabilia salmonicolor]
MKYITIKITFAFIAGLLVFTTGCNEDEFLTRYSKAEPNPENFFVDDATARMAVNACYHPWLYGGASMLNRDMTILLDAMTDDSYWRPNRGSSIALERWDISPTHDNVSSWWNNIYQSINAANFAIENIPNSSDANFTSEAQAPFIAEAKFLRGYNYLFLTSLYGGVPLFTSTASDFEKFNTGRSSKDEILEQVIADFQDAKEDLPDGISQQGTPTRAAAAAFLAKTYLVLEDWPNAEAAAREAIQIAEADGYRMLDDYMSIWSEEGNAELLFYWSFVNNSEDYGQNMTVQRLCRDLPSGLRIPIGGDGWGYSLPQRDLYDAFEVNDPRREYTLYSPGQNYEIYPGAEPFDYTHEIIPSQGDTVRWDVTYEAGDMVEYDYRWSPTGLNVRKMTKSVKDIANVRWDGLDIPVMRMAEVYLILAEALAEQDDAEALTWLNKVRSRPSVNMPDKTTADGDLVDLVRHERRVELAMEGLRLFDLLRWGTLEEVFGDGTKVKRNFYSDYLPESSSLKYDAPVGNLALDPIFPIPQDEIDQNSEINTNNPGW